MSDPDEVQRLTVELAETRLELAALISGDAGGGGLPGWISMQINSTIRRWTKDFGPHHRLRVDVGLIGVTRILGEVYVEPYGWSTSGAGWTKVVNETTQRVRPAMRVAEAEASRQGWPASKQRVERSAEQQRQFDIEALTRILAERGVRRWQLERCSECDAYRVRGEPRVLCTQEVPS